MDHVPLAIAAILVVLIGGIGLRKGVLSPMTWLGVHLLVGVVLRTIAIESPTAPVTGYFYNVLIRKADVSIDEILLLLSLAMVSLVIGYFGIGYALRGRYGRGVVEALTVPHDRISVGVCLAAFLGGWSVFLLAVVVEAGSVSGAFLMLQKRAILFGSDVILARAVLLVSAAGLASLAVKASARPIRSNYWLLLTILTCTHVLLLFQTGGRGQALGHAAVVLFAVISARPNFKPRMTLWSSLGALVIIPIVALTLVVGIAIRHSAQYSITLDSALSAAAADAPHQISASFPVLDLFAASKSYAQNTGYEYGSNYAAYVTKVIPRSIWEGKPKIIGLKMREYYFNDQLSGTPPTVFGEFYISFGVVGLIGGSILFGGLMAGLTNMLSVSRFSGQIAIIYMFLLQALCIGVVKAGFETSLFEVLYFFAGLLIVKGPMRLLSMSPNRRKTGTPKSPTAESRP